MRRSPMRRVATSHRTRGWKCAASTRTRPRNPAGCTGRRGAGRRTDYDQRMRALLVEDDPAIAEFVARGLREAGFAVDHAADGDAGLTAARDRSYDVAIVDLMLP